MFRDAQLPLNWAAAVLLLLLLSCWAAAGM
jgi:hypothetical protein